MTGSLFFMHRAAAIGGQKPAVPGQNRIEVIFAVYYGHNSNGYFDLNGGHDYASRLCSFDFWDYLAGCRGYQYHES